MKTIKTNNTIPDNSIVIKNYHDKIHYFDSYNISIRNPENLSVDYLMTMLLTSLPGWVLRLIKLRDFLVKPFGLEGGSVLRITDPDKSIHYNPGDKAVFFKVHYRTDSEIVFAENDKHLYFRGSVLLVKGTEKNTDDLYVSTIVHFHNIFGRLYFLPVKPFHRIIIRILLKNFQKYFCESPAYDIIYN